MSKGRYGSIKLSARFLEEARQEANVFHRSLSGQVEYWARIGQAVENAPGRGKKTVRDALEWGDKGRDPSHEEQEAFDELLAEAASIEEDEGDLTYALAEALRDSGQAARKHLESGRSIVYVEEDTPEGCLIREFPDGRRVLVRPVGGKEQSLKELA